MRALSAGKIVAKGDILTRAGDAANCCSVLLEGFAARSKLASDGEVQHISFLLPGDMCDLDSFLLVPIDSSVVALSAGRVAQLPHEAFRRLLVQHPRLALSFWRETMVDASIAREWVLNVGRRTALQRIAHVLCETYVRLRAVGLTKSLCFDFPLSQQDLADATGLSVVHVNRMLQRLKRNGLATLNMGKVSISNWPGLQETGDFDQGYLYARAMAAAA
jgi:CRP-like cAMP-binding protein